MTDMAEDLHNIYPSLGEAADQDDRARLSAILDGLTYDELLLLLGWSAKHIDALKALREAIITRADESSPYADRSRIAQAARVKPSVLYAVLERNGRPRNRRRAYRAGER